LNGFRGISNFSELWRNSLRILAALSAQRPLFIGWGSEWASGKNKPGSTVRTDNCATGFSEIFAEKSFLYKNIVRTGWLDRPDRRTSAASNFHNRLRASGPRGKSVQTAKLQHAISISDACASGPQGGDVQTVEVESSVTIYDALASGPKLSDVRTVHFELRFLPYGDTSPDGIPHRPDG